VTAGNTLELNCTIFGFPRNVTSDLIYFQPERPTDLGGQRVDVIDHATSRLRYPDVQRAENLGHVFCYVDNYDEYDHVSFRVAGGHERILMARGVEALSNCKVLTPTILLPLTLNWSMNLSNLT